MLLYSVQVLFFLVCLLEQCAGPFLGHLYLQWALGAPKWTHYSRESLGSGGDKKAEAGKWDTIIISPFRWRQKLSCFQPSDIFLAHFWLFFVDNNLAISNPRNINLLVLDLKMRADILLSFDVMHE